MIEESNSTPQEAAAPGQIPYFTIDVRGIDNEFVEQVISEKMRSAVGALAAYINIEMLDGITVAADYLDGLRAIDRGINGLPTETRTDDGIAMGVAKSLPVRRGNVVKTHVIFDAGPISGLLLPDSSQSEFETAIGIIAHELAHVEEHARRERQFPRTILAKHVTGFELVYLHKFAEAFWCEYAASRASAAFCGCQTEGFRKALSERLATASTGAQEAIARYRSHSDVHQLFDEVDQAIIAPLRSAAYLFGNLDGLHPGGHLPVRSEVGTTSTEMMAAIETLVQQLRALWDKRENWSSHDDMLILGRTAFDLFPQFGLHIEPGEGGGAYIRVP